MGKKGKWVSLAREREEGGGAGTAVPSMARRMIVVSVGQARQKSSFIVLVVLGLGLVLGSFLADEVRRSERREPDRETDPLLTGTYGSKIPKTIFPLFGRDLAGDLARAHRWEETKIAEEWEKCGYLTLLGFPVFWDSLASGRLGMGRDGAIEKERHGGEQGSK